MKKLKDLLIVAAIYLLAYIIGAFVGSYYEDTMIKFIAFDIAATIETFVFSVSMRNSSVYDPYWSLTPMIMSIWLFIREGAFSIWQIIFLVVFNIWSLRLTINWCVVFTDFSYEDWRYRKFRDENGPIGWFLANFFGIHMVPTVVVFLGMLPLFEIAKNEMNALSLIGDIVILLGVLLEYFADKAMHAFLNETTEKVCCRNGLWKYSRHPNYLGEITVWVGTFLVMLPYSLEHWYYGCGMVAIALLFNFISIPLMENRQKKRRPDYEQYKHDTSRLLLMPSRAGK